MSSPLASMRHMISPTKRLLTPSPFTSTSVWSISLSSYQLMFFLLCTVAQYGQVSQSRHKSLRQFSQGFLRSQPHSGHRRYSFSTTERQLGHRSALRLNSLSSTARSSSRSRESSKYS